MTLRVGIIGAGRIGSLHARNAALHPRVQVLAVHDVDSARSAALAALHGAQAFGSLDALLAAGIDAVIIASSTDTHADVALACARAGKAIYLEKPIDLDFTRALNAAQALRETNVPVMIGFNRRFDAAYRQLRDDVRAGALGRLQIVQMTSRGPNEAPTGDYIRHSGGIYRDKTVHFFDFLRYLSGREVVELDARGTTHADPFVGELGDVDTCVVQLELEDGVFCQVDNTRRAVYGFDERVEVLGTRGLREVGRGRSPMAGADERGVFGHALPTGFMQRFESAFAGAIDGFVRYVLDTDGDVPTLADGVAAQVLAEAATLSARERRPIQVRQLLNDTRS